MQLRKIAASMSISAIALMGLHPAAGAQISFSVSDTDIVAGGSVTVRLDEPCLTGEGAPEYGNVIVSSNDDAGRELYNHETKGDQFFRGSGTFRFDTPGTYTISRFCDGWGLCSQVTVTVAAPATTTTTTTTTTAAPGVTTTTVVPGATTTTTEAPKVEGVSSVNPAPAAATTAPAAERVTSTVSYTG